MLRTTILTAVAAVAMLGTGTTQASEYGQRYGAFTLYNPTSATISYELQWGPSGTWKTYSLEPGMRCWHYHNLSVHGTVPTPRVRYDCDLEPGLVRMQDFTPQTVSTTDPKGGTSYTFRFSGSRYVYLYED